MQKGKMTTKIIKNIDSSPADSFVRYSGQIRIRGLQIRRIGLARNFMVYE